MLRVLINFFLRKRIKRIYLTHANAQSIQEPQLLYIVRKLQYTKWGQIYSYNNINSFSDFKNNVPISTYEDIYPWIERMLSGEKNILYPSSVKWFAKSSGTTNAKSKYIPTPKSFLDSCHFRGGKDMIYFYLSAKPDSVFYKKHLLSIVGSLGSSPSGMSKIQVGDISAVIAKNLPLWAQIRRIPRLHVALLPSWEEKADRIIEAAEHYDVSALAGTPTWISMLLQGIRDKHTKSNIYECWPNLEVFFHGAVSFTPYKPLFEKLLPDKKVSFMEIYNASEGFFALQDDMNRSDMLLMLDYGVYYEFIPVNAYNDGSKDTISINEVSIGENYVLIISTLSGLARYVIGDTVRFTSLDPYRIVITGRTKQFINAFGEEVVVSTAEEAVEKACKDTGATIANFTVAPLYIKDGSAGSHEWVVEFVSDPDSFEKFETIVDDFIKNKNSDYEAKRAGDKILSKPVFHYASHSSFYNWMKSRNKLGGQYKVPRLSNNRDYVESLLEFMNQG